MANTAQSVGQLPSGLGICTTIPDIFYIPELIFGALVWCLIASVYVAPSNPLGWVMFVAVFCFVVTLIWLFLFLCGVHGNSSGWAAADFAYHALAAFFYLSASVVLAYITIMYAALSNTYAPLSDTYALFSDVFLKNYRIAISAVVFSFVTTLLYFLHTIFSANRWKHF